ncbi:SRPBCC family protein [Alkalicaulis satelles]|uniref:SRPBCC family protein n=1 Tax=Alkalicaulis satelles TaxID=2609175 RepID=A0A5M6ZR66_9PROT|nr:SRPBCC family protein [Alkalicaulis satelles]KAA5804771.1 SRPBCC family protein [Alkalicaulis satelles]
MPYDLSFVRVLRAPPALVWRALTDPAAIAKWNPPDGFVCEIARLDFQQGGGFKMAFRNLATGEAHPFTGRYREIVPEARLVADDSFDDPDMPGAFVTVFELRQVSMGTELTITQSGIPDMIPPEACRLGWQGSLDLLARLVEANAG